MGNTPASKTRCFCVLFVVHAAQVLSRTVTLALLFATQRWFAAVYLGGDFLVHVAYKAARRDLLWFPPGFGVPLSLLYGSVSRSSPTAPHTFRAAIP